jgi:cytochrome P450
MFCATLLTAGNETTRNLISGGAFALIQHPDQKRALLVDPGLIPNAVEEMLRWWPPLLSFTRHATSATSLRGKQIGEGDRVLLLYLAANRDEEVWGEDAERFDVRRDYTQRRHLSFGFGEHLCMGAALARLEARVMFEELLARLPEFEPAGPFERLHSRLMNGIARMPVVFKA